VSQACEDQIISDNFSYQRSNRKSCCRPSRHVGKDTCRAVVSETLVLQSKSICPELCYCRRCSWLEILYTSRADQFLECEYYTNMTCISQSDDTWTLHSILIDRFSNQPGYDLVRNRRYAIRDDISGLDIRQNKPLTYVLRPGQKINMCMVYFTGDKDSMMCPRCKRSTLRANNLVFTW
jgi:hypothetical protein